MKMKHPSSYDILGELIILNKKIPKKQAEYLLNLHKQARTVLYKSKEYSGKYRLPKLTILAGIKNKTTIHKESNVKININPEKAYFSVRSSNERLRISKLIKKNETILVMFSGVGIYPLVLSKNSPAKLIYGVEVNPEAHKLAISNVKLNKTKNVILLKGDVRKIVPNLAKKFDRIIMPHPSDSDSYLKLARSKLSSNGTIHLYAFAHENDFNKVKKEYKKQFSKVKIVKAGSPSPGKYRICLDLQN